MINNILDAGDGETRYVVYEVETSGALDREIHPEALQNNDMYLPNPGANDAMYRMWTNLAEQLLPDVASVNAILTTSGFPPTVTGSNFDDDPSIDATWHLQAGSACIEAGSATDAPPFDFEGDARPQGPEFDVGPDEVLVTTTP